MRRRTKGGKSHNGGGQNGGGRTAGHVPRATDHTPPPLLPLSLTEEAAGHHEQ